MRYGVATPPKAGAPSPSQMAAVLSGYPSDSGDYGMWFAPYVPLLHLTTPTPLLPRVACAEWQWARLPRFPASPVIPTVASGFGLKWQPPDVPGTKAAPMPPLASVTQYADPAASFLVWLYHPPAQALLRAAGFVPVVSAPNVQAPFWASVDADIRAFGDYANYAAGWPGVPPTDYVGQALAQAVAAPNNLAALVATAEQQCNAWLTQQASGA